MFSFFHLLLFSHFLLSSSTPVTGGARPSCPDKCGGITIPYPFGTTAGCYHDPSFQLTCNSSSSKLYITAKNIEITNISLDGTAVITGPVAHHCDKSVVHYPNVSIDILGTPYTFSNTRNKLTGLGCNFASVDLLKQSGSIAPIDFEYDMTYLSSGCTSMCPDKSDIIPGMCGGIGCCQTAIPKGHKIFRTFIIPVASRPQNVTPCKYAFLIDGDQFVFDWRELSSFGSQVPVVVDWAVGNQTCQAAKQAGKLECGMNAYCVDASNGQGYRCICNSGHQGNPYLPDGCQGMDFFPSMTILFH